MVGLDDGWCGMHRLGLCVLFPFGCENRWGAHSECDVCDSAGGECDWCCAVGRKDHVANALVWGVDFDGYGVGEWVVACGAQGLVFCSTVCVQVLHAIIGMAERFMLLDVIGMAERFMFSEVIGMAARAGMLFAALSLAKTSPHRRLWMFLVHVQLRCS